MRRLPVLKRKDEKEGRKGRKKEENIIT